MRQTPRELKDGVTRKDLCIYPTAHPARLVSFDPVIHTRLPSGRSSQSCLPHIEASHNSGSILMFTFSQGAPTVEDMQAARTTAFISSSWLVPGRQQRFSLHFHQSSSGGLLLVLSYFDNSKSNRWESPCSSLARSQFLGQAREKLMTRVCQSGVSRPSYVITLTARVTLAGTCREQFARTQIGSTDSNRHWPLVVARKARSQVVAQVGASLRRSLAPLRLEARRVLPGCLRSGSTPFISAGTRRHQSSLWWQHVGCCETIYGHRREHNGRTL